MSNVQQPKDLMYVNLHRLNVEHRKLDRGNVTLGSGSSIGKSHLHRSTAESEANIITLQRINKYSQK